mmetsp:Transcript_112370/g.323040  ORF Transcript_112370/g.323040 Transcript_112370/m.323040 type:complete len:257 (+) Transcript_112370:86-856(+)
MTLAALLGGPCKSISIDTNDGEDLSQIVPKVSCLDDGCDQIKGRGRVRIYDEEEEEAPLISDMMFVQPESSKTAAQDTDCTVVECEPCRSPRGDAEEAGGPRRANASTPGIFEVLVPQEHKMGDNVLMHGPWGDIVVRLPAEAQPGTTFKYPLRARPEFSVILPYGKKPGDTLTLHRTNGEDILVDVPKGMRPGDTFPVYPPVWIVQVPEGANPGARVIFDTPLGWYQATVPSVLQLNRYFAARIPSFSPHGAEGL